MINIEEISKFIKNFPGDPITPVQRQIVLANACVNPNNIDFDLLTFCEARGIDTTSVKDVARLFQYGKNTIEEFWDDTSLNAPNELLGLKTPESVYSKLCLKEKAQRYGTGNPVLGGR